MNDPVALESPEGLLGGIWRLTAHPQLTAVPPEAAVGLELQSSLRILMVSGYTTFTAIASDSRGLRDLNGTWRRQGDLQASPVSHEDRERCFHFFSFSVPWCLPRPYLEINSTCGGSVSSFTLAQGHLETLGE